MMDNELKALKNHLNRTVYRGQRFTEKNKMDIRQRIQQKYTQPHYNRFKSALSVIICFAILIALGTFAWKQMTSPNTTSPSAQSDRGGDTGKTGAAAKSLKPFTYIYAQHSQKNNLDAVIVATVNPNKKTVSLLSLPPSFQVKPGKYGVAEDLQSAFSKDELGRAVTKVLGLPIHNTATITDGSFKHLVDAAGGVQVNSPFAFTYMGYHFKKGQLQLDGNEALAYFTMLKQDPMGEIGRMQRQLGVLENLMQRVDIPTLKKYVGQKENVNLYSFVDSVVKDKKANDYQFNSLTLKLSTKTEDAIFYYVASPEDIQTVAKQIKSQLQ
jgi:polyisoprenyl-teichoic acid--peptidoglycan teichoic acid transferase